MFCDLFCSAIIRVQLTRCLMPESKVVVEKLRGSRHHRT